MIHASQVMCSEVEYTHVHARAEQLRLGGSAQRDSDGLRFARCQNVPRSPRIHAARRTMDGGVVVLILILLLLAALCAFRCYRKRQQANATIYSRVDESSHGFDAEELAFKRCGHCRVAPAPRSLTVPHSRVRVTWPHGWWVGMLHASPLPRFSFLFGMVAWLARALTRACVSAAFSTPLSPLTTRTQTHTHPHVTRDT